MRKKVIELYQLEDIRVNVLGHPEPFQQELAETTGGLWQQIPGDIVNAATLPSSRVANEGFMKVFRDIATDLRRNSGKLLFSMESQFEIFLEDGDVPMKKLQREFRKNGARLAGIDNLFGSATVWEKQKATYGSLQTIQTDVSTRFGKRATS